MFTVLNSVHMVSLSLSGHSHVLSAVDKHPQTASLCLQLLHALKQASELINNIIDHIQIFKSDYYLKEKALCLYNYIQLNRTSK